jgi:hypothetical protein
MLFKLVDIVELTPVSYSDIMISTGNMEAGVEGIAKRAKMPYCS